MVKIAGMIARRAARFAIVLSLLAVIAPLAMPFVALSISGEDEWVMATGCYTIRNGEREWDVVSTS